MSQPALSLVQGLFPFYRKTEAQGGKEQLSKDSELIMMQMCPADEGSRLVQARKEWVQVGTCCASGWLTSSP